MGRVKELDGLRAIAIIAVVAWHYLGIGDGPASTPWRVFIVGRSGVDLFFVLSGYLITSILLANSGSGHYFKTFYGRRSLRILPIYFLMVTVYLAGQNIHGDAARYLFSGSVPWWSYVIGLQNIWMAAEQTYGAYWFAGTWSLAIEEQFYLFFPLIVYWVPRRVLPWLLVALLVLCPIGRIMAYSLGDRFGYYVLMPLRADIMAIGSLIAWLEFSEAITASVRRVFRTAFWAAVVFSPSSPGASIIPIALVQRGATPTLWFCTARSSSWCWITGARRSSQSFEVVARRSSPVFPMRFTWCTATCWRCFSRR
jgi:peptidoglycan/LPS O-acetylase OafA/YrhL